MNTVLMMPGLCLAQFHMMWCVQRMAITRSVHLRMQTLDTTDCKAILLYISTSLYGAPVYGFYITIAINTCMCVCRECAVTLYIQNRSPYIILRTIGDTPVPTYRHCRLTVLDCRGPQITVVG